MELSIKTYESNSVEINYCTAGPTSLNPTYSIKCSTNPQIVNYTKSNFNNKTIQPYTVIRGIYHNLIKTIDNKYYIATSTQIKNINPSSITIDEFAIVEHQRGYIDMLHCLNYNNKAINFGKITNNFSYATIENIAANTNIITCPIDLNVYVINKDDYSNSHIYSFDDNNLDTLTNTVIDVSAYSSIYDEIDEGLYYAKPTDMTLHDYNLIFTANDDTYELNTYGGSINKGNKKQFYWDYYKNETGLYNNNCDFKFTHKGEIIDVLAANLFLNDSGEICSFLASQTYTRKNSYISPLYNLVMTSSIQPVKQLPKSYNYEQYPPICFYDSSYLYLLLDMNDYMYKFYIGGYKTEEINNVYYQSKWMFCNIIFAVSLGGYFPSFPDETIPIKKITNGVINDNVAVISSTPTKIIPKTSYVLDNLTIPSQIYYIDEDFEILP